MACSHLSNLIIQSSLFSCILYRRTWQKYGTLFQRQIPKTVAHHKELQGKDVIQPEQAKLLRVAIIGCPNVGKSTLLNQLVNWKVSAVSSKVHTTRSNTIGVFVEGNTQIEFVDTPGLVDKKHLARHNLDSSLLAELENTLINSDMVALLVDASNKREKAKLNPGILNLLRSNRDKESLLILNKIDKLSHKRELLNITSTLTSGIVGGYIIHKPDSKSLQMELSRGNFETLFKRTEKVYLNYQDTNKSENVNPNEDNIGWPNFSLVFMLSALHNDGVGELRSYLLNKAQPKPWLYNGDAVTPQRPRTLIVDAMREVCLDLLHQEIPYNIYFQIVMWELDELDNLFIAVDMYCPAKFQSLVIGPKGSTISTIVRKSREIMCNIFRCDVSLKINVKPSSK